MTFKKGDKVSVTVTAEIVNLSRPVDGSGLEVAELKYSKESVDTNELTLVKRKISGADDLVGTIRRAAYGGAWIKVSHAEWVLMGDDGQCSNLIHNSNVDFTDNPIIGSIPGTKAHRAGGL